MPGKLEQVEEMEVKPQPKKKNSKRNRGKRILIIIGLLFFTLLLVSLSVTAFTLLRYRQICTYSKLADNGSVEVSGQPNLCPNILDSSQLLTIVGNAFNFSLFSQLKVSDSYLANTSSIDSGDCNSATDPVCWLKQLKGELKNKDGITSIMLIGTDSRTKVVEGNTDSIMIASFDSNSGKVMFTSIPRDLYVQFRSAKGNKLFSRVNALYAFYGHEVFKGALEDITGRPIQYYAYINFTIFSQVIDKVGGVDIDLPADFENAYPKDETLKAGRKCIPANFDNNFCIFTFKKGQHHFDSFDALVYSRARELTSDWDRAKRQQEVATAVLKNALSKDGSIVDKFTFYTSLYDLVSSSVETNITPEDIGGMFKYVDKLSSETARVVLSPDVNNGKLVYQYGFLEGMGDVSKVYDYTYKSIHTYLDGILNNLTYYLETPKVLIVNTTDKSIPDSSTLGAFIKAKIPYVTIKQITDKGLDLNGVRVYDFSNGIKESSLNDILRRIPDALTYSSELDNVTQSKEKEDILIIYGGE